MSKSMRLFEIGETLQYLRKNESLMRNYKKVYEEMQHLVENYKDVLTDSERCMAYQVFWGCCAVEEYQKRFLYQVLTPCYKVFDKTHLKYVSVLNAIKANNPEWVSAFESAHEHKIAICKVSVYSLEEALTT